MGAYGSAAHILDFMPSKANNVRLSLAIDAPNQHCDVVIQFWLRRGGMRFEPFIERLYESCKFHCHWFVVSAGQGGEALTQRAGVRLFEG